MIARQCVFVERTLRDCRRRNDPGDVDVGKPVGKVVDVDLDAIAGHLTFEATVARPERLSKILILKGIESFETQHVFI
jgi:hypothetical protein